MEWEIGVGEEASLLDVVAGHYGAALRRGLGAQPEVLPTWEP